MVTTSKPGTIFKEIFRNLFYQKLLYYFETTTTKTNLEGVISLLVPLSPSEEIQQALTEIRDNYPKTVFECEASHLSRTIRFRKVGPLYLPYFPEEPTKVYMDIKYPNTEVIEEGLIKKYSDYSEDFLNAYYGINKILSKVIYEDPDFYKHRRIYGTKQPLSYNCPCLETILS